ncbi:hypothetical protein JCM13210_18660 [Thermaerobacter litoralis]
MLPTSWVTVRDGDPAAAGSNGPWAVSGPAPRAGPGRVAGRPVRPGDDAPAMAGFETAVASGCLATGRSTGAGVPSPAAPVVVKDSMRARGGRRARPGAPGVSLTGVRGRDGTLTAGPGRERRGMVPVAAPGREEADPSHVMVLPLRRKVRP